MSTSSKSTETGPPASPAAEAFTNLQGDDPPAHTEKDEAKATLERELQESKDAHREERFIWIVIAVILVDVLWFRNAPNGVVPVIVFVLELVVLYVLAGRLGIQHITALVERVMHGISRGGTGG